MRCQGLSWAIPWLCVLGLCAASLPAAAFAQSTAKQGEPIVGAKIVDLDGTAEVTATGETPRVLKVGEDLTYGQELTLRKGSRVTLAMSDRTLREFSGPTSLVIRPDVGPAEGTTLGNLTAAVAAMLFSGRQRTSEAVMATRMGDAGSETKSSVPVLIHPAPGENLAETPKQFRWKAIEGVPLYRVSVYSPSQLMWQGTAVESEAACPAKLCDFRPGEVYYWVVEAVVGNTTLRSQAATFTVGPADHWSALALALREADAAVPAPKAATALKVRLCLDSRAYSKAIDLLDQAIAGAPSRAAYTLRAEVYAAMGLTQEALADYREAIAAPSAE